MRATIRCETYLVRSWLLIFPVVIGDLGLLSHYSTILSLWRDALTSRSISSKYGKHRKIGKSLLCRPIRLWLAGYTLGETKYMGLSPWWSQPSLVQITFTSINLKTVPLKPLRVFFVWTCNRYYDLFLIIVIFDRKSKNY